VSSSGERTRLACWFWRLAKTDFVPIALLGSAGVSRAGLRVPRKRSFPIERLFLRVAQAASRNELRLALTIQRFNDSTFNALTWR
jgi:hypothetical protein